MTDEHEAWERLQFYTLGHGDPAFLHQHAVDAWTAQHADRGTKSIGLVFALIGLYLHVEKGLSGRQVQRIHMGLGRKKRDWPTLSLPTHRGSVTVNQVLSVPPGPERDGMIDAWCASVWSAFRDCRDIVIDLLRDRGIE